MILKSYEADTERSCTRVLFCNCVQNTEKEVIRFFREVVGEKHAA